MSAKLHGSVCIFALLLMAFLSGCATSEKQEADETDRLERWLYGENPVDSGLADYSDREPETIRLESLESESSDDDAAGDIPKPEYFSFILDEPGRVSIEAESAAGAEIAVIDRVQGVIARAGRAGQDDGRLDLTLEKGEYRVEAKTIRSEDSAEIRVTRFSSITDDSGMLMNSPAGELHSAVLADYQQVSYWITVEEDEPLIFEAMGRSLSEVHIWKDGLWIIDENPRITEYSPQPGRPMGYTEMYLAPEAGNYLITFYGGRAREWEDETGENPFYVRRGALYLGSTLDAETVISPMGRDAFIVSGKATIFEAENPDFEPAQIGLTSSLAQGRFDTRWKEGLEHDAESTRIDFSSRISRDRRWFSVQGTPGDSIRLRVLPSREQYELEEPEPDSRYLVSSISGLDSDHAVDAGALIIRERRREGRRAAVRREATRALTLRITPDEPLYREINIDDEVSLLVDFSIGGRWALMHDRDAGEVDAGALAFREVDESDGFEITGGNPALFDVEAGKHFIVLMPNRPGILKFVFYYVGDKSPAVAERNARNVMNGPAPHPRQDLSFITEKNEITPGSRHVVAMNLRGVPYALFVEPLPLTLIEPVPLTLEAGEEIQLPVRLHSSGFLSTGYQSVVLRRNGELLESDTFVPEGFANLLITNTSSSPRTFVLRLDSASTGRYEVPSIPDITDLYPVLEEGHRIFSDYERGESLYYILNVEKPCFYEIKTTGRLATGISTRTRVISSGLSAKTNGSGRNARLQEYLRPGEYLVKVETVGDSSGRAGLVFRRLPMVDLGLMIEDNWYRSEMDSGTALVGAFGVSEAGEFSVSSFGQYGLSQVRLEDEDAWPVLDNNLNPGLYRLYSWPQGVLNRRLTGIFRKSEDLVLPENGSWPLILDKPLQRVWMESEGRTPQEFVVTSPAPVPVQLSLNDDMEWWIADAHGTVEYREENGNDFVLETGEHHIFVRSREENNRASYTLKVGTEVLADGLSRTTERLPLTLPVVVGEEGIYEFWSFGSQDVRARLLSADEEREIAAGDDREGDWNFYFSRYLPEGEYRLKVEKGLSGAGPVTLLCRRREEVRTEVRNLPLNTEISLDSRIVGIPFTSGGEGPVIITCENQAIALSVYQEGRLLADGRERLVLPLESGGEYLLRLRNRNLDPQAARFSIEQPVCEKLSWDGDSELEIGEGSCMVENPRKLSCVVDPEAEGLWAVDAMATTAVLPKDGILPAPDGRIWLYQEHGGSTSNRIKPLYLEPDAAVTAAIGEAGLAFGLAPAEGKVRVLEAESMTGHLWMRPVEVGDGSGKSLFDRIHADTVSSSSILALTGEGQRRVILRDGNPVPGGRSGVLRLTEYDISATVSLTDTPSFSVEPRSALRIDTGNVKALSLLLSPDILAFTDNADGDGRTRIARGMNQAVQVKPLEQSVYLVNTGQRTGRVRIEAEDLSSEYSLTASAPLEILLWDQQTLEVRLNPGDEGIQTALWAENLKEAFLWTSSGRRIEARITDDGRALLPAVSGTLIITAGEGALLCWIDPGEGVLPSWMSSSGLGLAGELPSGEVNLESSFQSWKLTLPEERFVMLYGGGRGVTTLSPADSDGEAKMTVGMGRERDIAVLLPAGDYRISTHSIAGEIPEEPFGLISLKPERVSEVAEIGERFLKARERLVFELNLDETAFVGIGVDAENDNYETMLFDEALNEIGRGIYYYRELAAGRYYLLLRNGERPMRLRPVVLGDSGSRRGVPESIIEEYRGE